ncbi:MAG: kinase [Candidatus Saccharimonadales bacterium]
MSKLIILRGNSGSGKTTVATQIAKNTTHKTAVVDADQYRVHMFFPLGECGHDFEAIMSHNVQYCLEHGYDVIWDSIFYANDKNKTYLARFLTELHPTDNFIFNFDVSFEETVRRHNFRHKKNDFGPDQMKKWYKPVEDLGYDFEYRIPESNSLEQTVAYIRQTTGI